MNICAVVMSRNESDLIESFCRYTLSYCDSILICVYESIDNTRQIVQNLINEGLNISLMPGPPKPLEGFNDKITDAMSNMIPYAIERFSPDLILPLYPDEFYCDFNGASPRAVLEGLDENIGYGVPWRTFAYSKEPDESNLFVAASFDEYRDPSLERLHKAILSRKLYEKHRARFTSGCHELQFPDNAKVKTVVPDNLVLAHYPIRSRIQFISKAITGHVLFSTWRTKNDIGFHYKYMFDEILNEGDAPYNLMRKVSMEYSLDKSEIPKTISIEKGKLDTSTCSVDLTLKYTSLENQGQKYLLKSILREFDKAQKHYNHMIDKLEYAGKSEHSKAFKIMFTIEQMYQKGFKLLKKCYRSFIPKRLRELIRGIRH